MASRRFFSSGEKRGQSVAFRRQHPDQPVDRVGAVAQFPHPAECASIEAEIDQAVTALLSLKTLVRMKAGIVAPALKAVERKGA